MSTKRKQMQNLIRRYKDETGKTEIDMKAVAKFAIGSGWKLPKPKDPLERLSQEFSRAARDEIRHDPDTGQPYRANHAIPVTQGGENYHLWIDIDEATRPQMQKSLVMRRDQMIGDGLQVTLDAQHWNNKNPGEAPIQIPMDFTEDIEERLSVPNVDRKAS